MHCHLHHPLELLLCPPNNVVGHFSWGCSGKFNYRNGSVTFLGVTSCANVSRYLVTVICEVLRTAFLWTDVPKTWAGWHSVSAFPAPWALPVLRNEERRCFLQVRINWLYTNKRNGIFTSSFLFFLFPTSCLPASIQINWHYYKILCFFVGGYRNWCCH